MCSALILDLVATLSLGKLLQNILIVEYSSTHIWSHFSIGIYCQMSISMSQYMRKITLPTHNCRVVTRVEKGEDCVLRISDKIRPNKETLNVAVSTLMCKKNPDFQLSSETRYRLHHTREIINRYVQYVSQNNLISSNRRCYSYFWRN